MAAIAEPKVEKVMGVDKWEAENAADTLARAGEIVRNRKLRAAALKVTMNRQKGMKQVMGWAGGLKP